MSPFQRHSPLFWALWLSLLTHLVLVTLHFQPELNRLKDQIPSLEVMLVNSKTLNVPKKADALAQVNLDRGGNTDQNRQLKSPLPNTPHPSTPTNQQSSKGLAFDKQMDTKAAELEYEKQRVAVLEQEAQILMTQLKSQQTVSTLQTQKHKQTPTQKKISVQEIAKLEALIAKQQEDYEMRPKRQFIGARTQEYRFAHYVEKWRQKIERVGNLNYPEAAKAKGLYGELQLTVSVRADGSIESMKINKSSGHKLLDDAAQRIVRLAAPFDPFQEDVRQDTDVISITRTWTFTRLDGLITE